MSLDRHTSTATAEQREFLLLTARLVVDALEEAAKRKDFTAREAGAYQELLDTIIRDDLASFSDKHRGKDTIFGKLVALYEREGVN